MKKLKLKKSIIANIGNDEMNRLKGGNETISPMPSDEICTKYGRSCQANLCETSWNICRPTPSPDQTTQGETCYDQGCNPETSAPCTY